MRLSSIRARMTAAFVLSIVLLLALVGGGLNEYARHTATRNADALMKSAADRVERDLRLEGPHAGLEDELADMRAENLALKIVDAQGRVVKQSEGAVPAWPHTESDGWRVLTRQAGPETIIIGTPWEKTGEALQREARVLLALSLCVVLAAAIGAWVLVGRTLAPIGALSRQAQAASSESLNIRLEPPSDDTEVVDLVATLNGLLARVSETATAKGRFYAAASHELRTPLQALLGHLEVARQRERSREEYQDFIEEAHEQTRRLTSLVRDLLLLNQLDASPMPPPKSPVNLADLCERLLEHYRPLSEQRGLQVQAELGSDVEILAPPTQVDMLVRNLIENAVKYAAPGGEVRVELGATAAGARLELFDSCAPLPPQVAASLFEPFYRPDASRNSATGGNGLGLAICKAITVANGWTLILMPDPSGFRIAVQFLA